MPETEADILERLNQLVSIKDDVVFTRLEDLEVESRVGETKAIARCYGVKLSGNGIPQVKKLVDYMLANILDYCIPASRIKEAEEEDEKYGGHARIVALTQEARTLFTHLKTTGEPGELLLYIIVTKILRLPLLMCKMDLKTDPELHYNGVDGVHGKIERSEDGEHDILGLYWGESKVHKSFGNATRDCVASLRNYVIEGLEGTPGVERDRQLISANLNIVNEELKSALVLFFNSDRHESNLVNYRGVALIGFDEESYPVTQNTTTVEEIKKLLTSKVDGWVKSLNTQIDKYGDLHTIEMHFFLLPLPSVEAFREEFLKAL